MALQIYGGGGSNRGAIVYAAGRKWAFLGDSITFGTGSTNVSTTSFVSQVFKIAGSARVRAESVRAGVAGETSAQILARTDAVIAQGIESMFLLCGTNDAGSAVPSTTYAANVTAINNKCRAAGVRLVVGTVPPRATTATAAIRTATAAYNLWLRLWAPGAGVTLVDVFGTLADPVTGGLKAAYDSGDGIHPNDEGHYAIASVLAPVLAAQMPTQPWMVAGPNPANLVSNPLMVVGGFPGVASGWDGFGPSTSVSYALEAPVGGDLPAGQWQTFTLGTTHNNYTGLQTTQLTGGASVGAPGDILLVCGYVGYDAITSIPANFAGPSLSVYKNGAATLVSEVYSTCRATRPGPIMTKVTVPASFTSLQLGFTGFCATGQSAKFRFGAMGVFNLTALGLSTLV